jgi:superfamily II DNA or RNA helicase
MIDVQIARELLDFGARIGQGPRADEQLEGAVALHNILESTGIAYLADEVGMGKTYVALGALSLFRHFNPSFRVLVLSPRRNIQQKWMKELRNFVANNVRFSDLRVKSIDGKPARELVSCENLLDLVHEVSIDRDRDFFARLTSFSLPVAGRDSVDSSTSRRFREQIQKYLPWLRDEIFDLRNKNAFKDNFAKALCCALPMFDLVIVDEAHNLKHGFGENVSSRNRVLGLAMGHPGNAVDSKLFPNFGPRAKKVLFLSATPVEESYRQLWNQLDVFGLGQEFQELAKLGIDEESKKKVASSFLIRRVTAMRMGDREYTKNQYRREWRRGGVHQHDKPIPVSDVKQRLIVALVQKKVSELLGHDRFNSSFQIGMLASFESFLETAKLKSSDDELSNFDDADQTDDTLEKEGVDVGDINKLARDYKKTFGKEMPHPKMDALVDALADSWTRGRKSLVFVRRVASVKELKRKLDERYDDWILRRLKDGLPSTMHDRLDQLFKQYEREKLAQETSRVQVQSIQSNEEADYGGIDTFFAWFFRGEGPRGVISGANIQQRFIQRGAAYATFFAENYAAMILGCRPGEVEATLSAVLGMPVDQIRTGLRGRSRKYLSNAKKHPRADRFEAVQAAAIEWLRDAVGPLQERSQIVWHERFESSIQAKQASEVPDIGNWLELKTFFTELRHRSDLRLRLWPEVMSTDFTKQFREVELRAQLLTSAARLGHGLIDLYLMTMSRLNSFELRTQEAADENEENLETSRIYEYLDLLESQMDIPLHQRTWGAFDELSSIAENFELILDVNAPESLSQPLVESSRAFGQLLRQQQPTGGMSGQVNQTLVRQFRMPGYPFALITTDLLQEGEDLHTFCSEVHHYGISWTPSAMEQRIGRIDRVRSHTDRRLTASCDSEIHGEQKLQVYFPHLEDTVEVLQVQRVLERMNTFIRLMHEGLTVPGQEQKTIDANQEFLKVRRLVEQIEGRLHSAFPIRSEHLAGSIRKLAVEPTFSNQVAERFAKLREQSNSALEIEWEKQSSITQLTGTVRLGPRIQPFTILLQSIGSYPVVRCISPVGLIVPSELEASIIDVGTRLGCKIGAILTSDDRTYDLTVEGEVMLADSASSDLVRCTSLISKVVQQADFIEQEFLPQVDEVLETFRDDLLKESSNEP